MSPARRVLVDIVNDFEVCGHTSLERARRLVTQGKARWEGYCLRLLPPEERPIIIRPARVQSRERGPLRPPLRSVSPERAG